MKLTEIINKIIIQEMKNLKEAAEKYYYVSQDFSYGHDNGIDKWETTKEQAIERADDRYSYEARDQNGQKTWVEDQNGRVVYRPNSGTNSRIISRW